ncbi:hypothetical protein GCM10010517_35080 [Streptosporangium fragile]|uniref:VCBS repeat-containing protein n=1 Tax=Streptosporangium fragile TaxID=46186 RepID=A0ABN3VYD3_9ACTN
MQAAAGPNTDFNGDGYNDLAFGIPHYPGYLGADTTGLVGVLYGGPDGLGRHQIIRPQSGCVSTNYPDGSPAPCYLRGRGLSATDVDADGRTDLVFAGGSDMQVMAWKPTGIHSIVRRTHVSLDTANRSGHLVAGQIDGQPGVDIVSAHSDQRKLIGWYNGAQASSYTGPSLPGVGQGAFHSLDTADLDGDGKLEAVTVFEAGWNGD